MINKQDAGIGADSFGGTIPGKAAHDRLVARALAHRLDLGPHLKGRFASMDRSLDELAFRDPDSGELYLSRRGVERVLSPLMSPTQAEALMEQMSRDLGTRLRDSSHGHSIPWDLFQLESGMAAMPAGGASIFDADLQNATTSEEVRAAMIAAVPGAADVDMVERAKKWINESIGGASVSGGLDTHGHHVAFRVAGLNRAAVTVCIEQKIASWWWTLALFVVAAMLITFPAWWIGLALSGIVVAGWLLVIILNCLISVG